MGAGWAGFATAAGAGMRRGENRVDEWPRRIVVVPMGNTLLFNLGSCRPDYYNPLAAAVGLLRIGNGRVCAEVVPVRA